MNLKGLYVTNVLNEYNRATIKRAALGKSVMIENIREWRSKTEPKQEENGRVYDRF